MTWSPEELVKALRYPHAHVPLGNRGMRDAADLIERLTRDVAYVGDLLADMTRECQTAEGRRDARTLDEIAALRAELADLNYHYECAITDRDVANPELAEWAAQDERNLAELAEQRRELKATQAGWLVEINKVARVQELCDERDESARSVYAASWVFVSDVLAAIEGNQP